MYAIRATYLPKEDMRFDRDYYVNQHMPLARKQMADRVQYLQMHAEFDMRVLMDGDELRSPCVFVLHVAGEDDVAAFREFRRSADCVPLAEDVAKYTNCRSEWTAAEIVAT